MSTLVFIILLPHKFCRNVKNTLKLNEKMLDMGVEDSESWHKQYKDSAYIFIGEIYGH